MKQDFISSSPKLVFNRMEKKSDPPESTKSEEGKDVPNDAKQSVYRYEGHTLSKLNR